MWLNLIKLTLPALTCSDPLVFANHYMVLHYYHRDVISEINLDTNAVVSHFDLKTWGFLIYPNDDGEQENSFDALMKQILFDGIIPLAWHYFQGYFSPRGPVHQVYCQHFLEFAEVQLKAFASSWRLTDCLIGIQTDGMQVEVLFYPAGRFP
jgi:hypothetical protein